MNLGAVHTFMVVVATKSISKAADRLFVTQSTVSQQIKSLENELGVNLLDRRRGYKTIELTAKGLEFVPIAERLLQAEKEAGALQYEKKASISVGCVDSLNLYMFKQFYQQFLQNNDVNLLISTYQTPEIYELVQNRQIDCGLVLGKLRYPNIRIEPLFSEKMVMVSKTYYDTDFIEPIHVDFSREVLLNWGYDFILWHNSWCDPRVQPMLQVDTVAMLLYYLNIDQSWAILPESVALALEKSDGLLVYDFKDPPPHRFVYLINHLTSKPGNIETVKLFQSEIKKYVNLYMHN